MGPRDVDGGGGGEGSSSSSCLSIFGLSFDATEREVHVLFSACPGYQRCIVVPGKAQNQKPYAFVQFGAQAEAFSAMDAREGTTWEDGAPAVTIELARRDIPAKFVPRQQAQHWAPDPLYSETPSASAASRGAWGDGAPAAKRQRREPAWGPDRLPAKSWGGSDAGYSEGPRTLHLGGLPVGLSQENLDDFLVANFGDLFVGSKLNDVPGRSGRAFVGFVTHTAAEEAHVMLEGFAWDDAVLRVEWARSEFKPSAVTAAAWEAPAAAAAPLRPRIAATGAPATRAATGSARGPVAQGVAWGSGKGGGGGERRHPGKGEESWAPVTCTLHFTGLPHIKEDEFEAFLQDTFPDQVTCAHFKDSGDGRPPIAWVLFEGEDAAAAALESHGTFEWQGAQVYARLARSELDPSRFKR